MTELKPDALHILELARNARTPSLDDKARVEQRLSAVLAVGAAVQAGNLIPCKAAAASNLGSAGSVVGKPLFATATFKWLAGGIAMVSAIMGGQSLLDPITPSRPAITPPQAVLQATQSANAVSPNSTSTSPPPSISPEQPNSVQTEEGPTATEEHTQKRTHRVNADRVRPRKALRDTLVAELELLHQARNAWQSEEVEVALKLLAQHGARYPASDLRFERDALRVLSLCDADRITEAQHLAKRFLRTAPNSPLRHSVQRSCVAK